MSLHLVLFCVSSPAIADIDECLENISGCSQICVNHNGSYECKCDTAEYVLASDGHNCSSE